MPPATSSIDSSGPRLRLALLGCGVVGRLHAQRLAADPRVELAVCCDPDRATAQRLRDEYAPRAAVETDLRRALADHDLRGVVICSPTLMHYEQCRLAFDLGLDVLCEKPLCGQRGEIVDLIARARSLERLLVVSYQRRYKAPYVTARRELSQRTDWYGPLRQVHVFVCERWQQTIQGTWRDDPRVGAGYFGDAGSHQIDVVDFITGQRPTSVLAVSDARGSRVEIVTQAIARLSGGAGLAAHFVGDANHWREDIHFHCRDADLLLRSEKLFRARQNQIEEIIDLEPHSSPDGAFVDAMIEGKPTSSPAEIALPMHDWTAAVLRSIGEGRWVECSAESHAAPLGR
ncbi:MAG TPA: Gfo/Idh/MocA family oxidoreductase [Pirellulales bacterium]|nr:Gfo/Idh/MocA family oxidoreductase [Pirellulales bacterium]